MLYESLWIKINYSKFNIGKNKNKEEKKLIDELIQEKDVITINLDSSFWEAINEKALEKCLKFFENNYYLQSIDSNEEKVLNTLKIFYKYVKPQSDTNINLRIVPNQNGCFCKFKDLCNEKDMNENFKKMLKEHFSYDISEFLIHTKLKNIGILKELTINDKMITQIKQSFYLKLNENDKNTENDNIKSNNNNKGDEKNKKIYIEQYSKYLKKAKELIHFYPRNEGDENLVKKFIECYKVISGNNFKEEEINTTNNTLWEKAIKILLIDLLKMIKADGSLSKTLKRLNMEEEKEGDIINNLNNFYYILFIYLNGENEKAIIDDFEFIPNERKIYKKLNDVYVNKDIDEEIKDIYSYLDEKNYFKTILIPKSINLSIKHQEKCLSDIALVIDKEIKKRFTKIDALIEIKSKENKIDNNFKICCKKLIQEWFDKHDNDRNKFEFVNNNIADISIKIIDEGKNKNLLDKLFIKGYSNFIDLLLNKNILKNIDENNNPCNKINNIVNNNFDNINNDILNSNRNYERMNNGNYQEKNRNYYSNNSNSLSLNSFLDGFSCSSYFATNSSFNNKENDIPSDLKQYYLAQAYVYEDLQKSNLDIQIDWKNKVNNNEEGEEITLKNNNKYRIKKSDFNFDFIVTSNNHKITNIIVKVLNEKRYNYIKLKCTVNQWNLFNNEENEQNKSIFALVRFQSNNTPEIFYIKTSNLNEIFN